MGVTVPRRAEGLQKPQGPFLSMVLDGGVADGLNIRESRSFLEVTNAEFAPGVRVCLAGTKQGSDGPKDAIQTW
jgi:hypothetical protein